ncbi:hypothetical protein QQF64_020968 [Cirrhinus molitorella]|uniref:Uncharacterized protein n=1 Tax=Cirrhinus molitorella TaxID=172907 RepID=A0ABR3LEK4_9TELE
MRPGCSSRVVDNGSVLFAKPPPFCSLQATKERASKSGKETERERELGPVASSPPPPVKAVSHSADGYIHLHYLVNERMSSDCLSAEKRVEQEGDLFIPRTLQMFGRLTAEEGNCVYIESRRPNTPYFICSIQDFKLVS